MDINFYVHSPKEKNHVYMTGFVRILDPTDRKVDLVKFDMLHEICRYPSLEGRVNFELDHYDDGSTKFVNVIASWKQRLTTPQRG